MLSPSQVKSAKISSRTGQAFDYPKVIPPLFQEQLVGV